MVTSFFATFTFFSVLIVLNIRFQVRAITPRHVMHIRFQLRSPKAPPSTCYCGKSYNQRNGICYYMTSKDESKCASRPCSPSYICKPGTKSGTICIRRKITSKIVLREPGKCQVIPIVDYMYVPYNSAQGIRGLSETLSTLDSPVVIPTKNVHGLFLVVANNRIVAKVTYLNSAKYYLQGFKTGPRCIFQVQGRMVIEDPKKISGYPQLHKYGFNKYWRNSADIQRMFKLAQQKMDKTNPITGLQKPQPPIMEGGMPDCETKENVKGEMKCDTKNNFCYYSPRYRRFQTYNFYQSCCDTFVCSNLVPMIAAGTSWSECCIQYNQGSRVPKSGFIQSEDLKFANYGDAADKTIHVYLL